jgi:hypothetical protein
MPRRGYRVRASGRAVHDDDAVIVDPAVGHLVTCLKPAPFRAHSQSPFLSKNPIGLQPRWRKRLAHAFLKLLIFAAE